MRSILLLPLLTLNISHCLCQQESNYQFEYYFPASEIHFSGYGNIFEYVIWDIERHSLVPYHTWQDGVPMTLQQFYSKALYREDKKKITKEDIKYYIDSRDGWCGTEDYVFLHYQSMLLTEIIRDIKTKEIEWIGFIDSLNNSLFYVKADKLVEAKKHNWYDKNNNLVQDNYLNILSKQLVKPDSIKSSSEPIIIKNDLPLDTGFQFKFYLTINDLSTTKKIINRLNNGKIKTVEDWDGSNISVDSIFIIPYDGYNSAKIPPEYIDFTIEFSALLHNDLEISKVQVIEVRIEHAAYSEFNLKGFQDFLFKTTYKELRKVNKSIPRKIKKLSHVKSIFTMSNAGIYIETVNRKSIINLYEPEYYISEELNIYYNKSKSVLFEAIAKSKYRALGVFKNYVNAYRKLKINKQQE